MATITTIKERITQLDPAGFQILCDAYLSREGYPNLVALGTMAGTERTTQGTPDTYFCKSNGKYVFAEYTTQTTGVVDKIRSDLEKCLNPEKTGIPLESLAEIVYCHTSSNITPQADSDLKELCSKANVILTLVGIDKLAEDLFTKYHILVKEHLNLSIDTEQIQSYDDFLQQHDANTLAAPLNTVFSYRERELSEISEAFANTSVVLLCGPAGVGKTRLALEYAKARISQSSETFYCIHNRSIPLYDDVSMFFEKPGKYFLFIDDANQLSQMELILELVNKKDCGFDVQIIASVRDYALQKVKATITGIATYTLIAVKPFNDEQIQTIIKDNYEITNDKYLERIARIAEGNCRIAILAAKVSCNANRLDSINDATALYDEYYGKVLTESSLAWDAELLKAFGILAFLNSIRLDSEDELQHILTISGLDRETFVECVHKLHDNELVDIYYDQAVVFSEQCLSNYILKSVFCDKKLLSLSQMIRTCFLSYRSRTVHAVSTLINVFHNDSVASFVESEIRLVWNQLAEECSPDFLEYVKAFYLVNQTETLIILKNMIEAIESVSIDPSEIDTKAENSTQSVDDDILTILGGFADTDNLESALGLYFEYYLKRPDQYNKYVHAFSTYYSVTRRSFECGFYTQKLFVKTIFKYSENWTNKYICLLFLDVSEELLKLEFSPIESSKKGQTIVLYHIPLPSSHDVFEYRDALWSGLLKLAEMDGYLNSIINRLRRYGNRIDETNKGVVMHDSAFICRILLSRCSVEDLNVCLVAGHLQDVFLGAGFQTSLLKPFTDSSKMQIYNLLIGPQWDPKTEYGEHEELCRKNIINYMKESKDLCDSFVLLYKTFQECVNDSDADKYKVAKGINIALQALSNNKEAYLTSIRMVMRSENLEGIDTIQITNNLFRLMDASEVYTVISDVPTVTANIWEYSYFVELPSEKVNQIELQKLYEFLKKDNDRYLKSCSYRDIVFVNKFSVIDANVLLYASEIVLSKQAYSPFMVSIYFGLLFSSHSHSPAEIVNMFSSRITLLEEIYSFLETEDRNLDYTGELLYAVCSADGAYLSQFACVMVNAKSMHRIDDMHTKCQVFYNCENYISVIDSIIDNAFEQVAIAELYMPDIIKQFLIVSEGRDNSIKIESWVKHYIVRHNHDAVPMYCLFSALSQLSIGQLAKYLEVFIENNKDFSLFEIIPLTPTSWSWSGSEVSLYSSWIAHLESLLPLFHGIDFVEHKRRVENMIESYRKQIKDAEIMEVLKG